MTVIAWDGFTLAADKRNTTAGVASTVTKIFRVEKELVALHGAAAHALELLEWFKRGALPSTFPSFREDERGFICVIGVNGKVRIYEGPYPMPHEDPLFACGAGRDFALAAMALGHTAAEAVAVACQFDVNCGNGIDTLTLNDE